MAHEQALLAALAIDLGKPGLEAWISELGFTISDIDHTLINIDAWSANRKVATPTTLQATRMQTDGDDASLPMPPLRAQHQIHKAPTTAAAARCPAGQLPKVPLRSK